MPVEDFTTYTEEDPEDHISYTSNHIDFTAYRDEDAYLYKDYGENHFGDFTHDIDVYCDTRSGVNPIAGVWALTNDVDDLKGIKDAGGTAICVQFYRKSDGTLVLRLREIYDFTNYVDDYVASYDTWYYLVIEKNGTSLTCKIYSDSARTNLLDTLSLTLNGNWQFRYVFAAITNNTGNSDYFVVDIENLDLNEGEVIIKTVEDSLSLSDSVLCDKTLAVEDMIGLADSCFKNWSPEVADAINLAEQILTNKTLLLQDSVSLSDLIEVLTQAIKEVTDFISLSDEVLTNKTLVITDGASLIDNILRNKQFEITDVLSLSDSVLANKSLMITDSVSLADLIQVITETIKEIVDSISLSDQIDVNKTLLLTDQIQLRDNIYINKILLLTDQVSLVEVVEKIIPGVVKTKLFLILGDIAIQLTGD